MSPNTNLSAKFKFLRWKLHLTALFLLLIAISNTGCKKTEPTIEPDEYYVKYILNSPSTYPARKLNVTLNNEKNLPLTITVNQNTTSENIIGPVAKGFNAKIKAVAVGQTYNNLKLYTEIHVSKDSGPFAIKAINGSDTPRDSIELNYTIDF